MDRLEVTTLGGVDIRINGRSLPNLSARKAQALLVYLAITGKRQSRQMLAGMLWGDLPEANARRNLRVLLTKMPDAVSSFLHIRRQALAFHPDRDIWLDVSEFEACLTPANPTIAQLQRATDLYHGLFLHDLHLRGAPLFEEWIRPLQERYRQLALETLYYLARHYTEQRQYATAIDHTNRLLQIEPWMEEGHRQLMLLLVRSGQRTLALAQYDTCCTLLNDELGVAPAAATTALYHQILNEEIEPDTPPLPAAAAPAAAAPMQIPAPITHFVGRADLVADLTTALTATAAEPVPVQAVVGMGGVGKSTLAVQVARAVQHHFEDGVLWANIAGSEPMAVLESWAAAYGYDFSRIADLHSLAAAFRGVLADKRVLIVLDDATSISRIRPLLPGGDHCRVLLTTRDQDLARALHARVWPLQELSPIHGRLLLTTILGEARVAAEPDAADTICALLQNLPLALEITAQRLKSRPQRRLAEMAQRLHDETQRLSLLTISDRQVRASFSISWETLDAERQRVFALVGLFKDRSFTAAAIAYIADMDIYLAEDQLFALVALSLLREEADRRYRQHPLLADFAREQLGDEALVENGRFASYYLQFAQAHRHDFAALRPEWDNLAAALEAAHATEQWPMVLALAQALRAAWFRRGRFSQARQAYRLVYDAAAALSDTAQMAETLLWWGKAAVEQRDHEAALRHFSQSQSLFAELNATAGVADCKCEMARVALEQSRFDDAIALLAESRRIRHDLHDAKGVAETWYVEARVAYFRGAYETAVALAQRALAIQEALDDTLGLIYTLSLLASATIHQDDLDAAEQFAQRAKALCDASDNASDKSILLDVLADIYRRRGQLAAAERFARESLALVQRFGDVGSQAQVLYQLCRIAYSNGDYDAALTHGELSLDIARELAYELLMAAVLNQLGKVYLARRQIEEARHLWVDALQISQRLQHGLLIEMVQAQLAQLSG